MQVIASLKDTLKERALKTFPLKKVRRPTAPPGAAAAREADPSTFLRDPALARHLEGPAGVARRLARRAEGRDAQPRARRPARDEVGLCVVRRSRARPRPPASADADPLVPPSQGKALQSRAQATLRASAPRRRSNTRLSTRRRRRRRPSSRTTYRGQRSWPRRSRPSRSGRTTMRRCATRPRTSSRRCSTRPSPRPSRRSRCRSRRRRRPRRRPR